MSDGADHFSVQQESSDASQVSVMDALRELESFLLDTLCLSIPSARELTMFREWLEAGSSVSAIRSAISELASQQRARPLRLCRFRARLEEAMLRYQRLHPSPPQLGVPQVDLVQRWRLQLVALGQGSEDRRLRAALRELYRWLEGRQGEDEGVLRQGMEECLVRALESRLRPAEERALRAKLDAELRYELMSDIAASAHRRVSWRRLLLAHFSLEPSSWLDFCFFC